MQRKLLVSATRFLMRSNMKKTIKYKRINKRLVVGIDTTEWYSPCLCYMDGILILHCLCFIVEFYFEKMEEE